MVISALTDSGAMRKALAEFDALGGRAFRKKYEFGASTRYYVRCGERLYDAKAIAGVAYGYQHGHVGALKNEQFSGGEATTNKVLTNLGYTVVDSRTTSVEQELAWRLAVWGNLVDRRDESGLLTPDDVRSVGAYGSFRGIWTDAARTKHVHPAGVTMGLKHTGQHYPDDLHDNGVLYHYPVTARPGQDRAEVNATKAAGQLKLPVFVITETGERRGVHLAWVEGWEDESSLFLVQFGETPPGVIVDRDRSEEEAFVLEGARQRKRTTTARARPEQGRFKLEVFRRYGPRCPLSGIAVPQMVDAAHLRGVADGGSYDPRNGLPLNAALHRAFDADLFSINPETLCVEVLPEGPSLDELGIVHPKLDLAHLPHPDALQWRHTAWLRRTGRSVPAPRSAGAEDAKA